MSGMQPEHDDSELLARLQSADPAAFLTPADPDRVARLLEAAMTDTDVRTDSSSSELVRETGTRGRNPLTWIVAAASVALIAGAGAFALHDRGQRGTTPQATDSVTQLTTTPVSAKCIPLGVSVLKLQTIAFRGRLTEQSDGSLTFLVDHWFKGGPTTKAQVTGPTTAMRPLIEASHFKLGESYLIAAHDGQVTACGYSGPATGRLSSLYDQAYRS